VGINIRYQILPLKLSSFLKALDYIRI